MCLYKLNLLVPPQYIHNVDSKSNKGARFELWMFHKGPAEEGPTIK